jgi:hypothetical protein
MISARGRARTRRFLLIGLMLSLMVHLLGGSLYGLFARAVVKALPQLASLQAPKLPKSDIIRLEKAQPTAEPAVPAPPKPRPKQPPPPPPVPHVAQRPIVAPVEEHHEIAHITIHAPRQTAPSRGQGVAELPHVVRPAAAPPSVKSNQYSDQQIASLNSSFEKALADSHQTLQQANSAMASAPKITSSHFQMTFSGIHEGMNPGDGIITVVSYQRIGKVMWYYTHYEYEYGDGHIEEDDIPWPFHYGPGEHDPFASGDRRVAIQPPPPGYKPTRELKPQLMVFFGGPEVR